MSLQLQFFTPDFIFKECESEEQIQFLIEFIYFVFNSPVEFDRQEVAIIFEWSNDLNMIFTLNNSMCQFALFSIRFMAQHVKDNSFLVFE